MGQSLSTWRQKKLYPFCPQERIGLQIIAENNPTHLPVEIVFFNQYSSARYFSLYVLKYGKGQFELDEGNPGSPSNQRCSGRFVSPIGRRNSYIAIDSQLKYTTSKFNDVTCSVTG